mgnify:CR=1 FL=1
MRPNRRDDMTPRPRPQPLNRISVGCPVPPSDALCRQRGVQAPQGMFETREGSTGRLKGPQGACGLRACCRGLRGRFGVEGSRRRLRASHDTTRGAQFAGTGRVNSGHVREGAGSRLETCIRRAPSKRRVWRMRSCWTAGQTDPRLDAADEGGRARHDHPRTATRCTARLGRRINTRNCDGDCCRATPARSHERIGDR